MFFTINNKHSIITTTQWSESNARDIQVQADGDLFPRPMHPGGNHNNNDNKADADEEVAADKKAAEVIILLTPFLLLRQ